MQILFQSTQFSYVASSVAKTSSSQHLLFGRRRRLNELIFSDTLCNIANNCKNGLLFDYMVIIFQGELDTLITPGSQDALSKVFDMTINIGDPLFIEQPTYPGTLAGVGIISLFI